MNWFNINFILYIILISSCLDHYNQDQTKCQKEIDLLVKCCYKLHTTGRKSVCCGKDITVKFPKETDLG